MMTVSSRTLDRIYSVNVSFGGSIKIYSTLYVLLLAVVVLSWSYVIYSSRIAAQWLLEKRTALSPHD